MIRENIIDIGEQKSIYKDYLVICGLHNYDL